MHALEAVLIFTGGIVVLAALTGTGVLIWRDRQKLPGAPIAARVVSPLAPNRVRN
jgi:hypothetical protein